MADPFVLIRAGNASEWTGATGNNTYLFPGHPAALIDAGVGRAEHIDAVARGLGALRLERLLLTHHHVDHVAGTPALKARWPGIEVRGGGEGAPLTDGEGIDAGGRRLRVVHTPGHAPDHFCFFDDASGDLFCGDLVRRGGTVVIPASRGGNLRQYLESLHRVRELAPARLLPAHGPAIEDPAAVIEEYLAHRELREQQVRDALAAGLRTPAAIAARIYRGLSPALRPAAEETVRAHLQKLDEER